MYYIKYKKHELNYYIMHATYNRFIILDVFSNYIKLIVPEVIDLIIKKHNEVTYDQFIIFYSSRKFDCEIIIYNLDGKLAEACGNATSCVTFLLVDKLKKHSFSIKVVNRIIYTTFDIDNGTVIMNMGKVITDWQKIPLLKKQNCFKINAIEDKYIKKYGHPMAFNIGNPHLIFFDVSIDSINMEDAYYIEQQPLFPEGINISFVEKRNDNDVFIRVWERGVGETKSCGSAACVIYNALCYTNFFNYGETKSLFFRGGSIKVYSDESYNIHLINTPIKL